MTLSFDKLFYPYITASNFVDGVTIPFDPHTEWLWFSEGLLEQILYRMPLLGDVQVNQLVNGPESFTPDGMCVMGECPEVSWDGVCGGVRTGKMAS